MRPFVYFRLEKRRIQGNELKRRSTQIGAFPNNNSLFRLAYSFLVDINEEWITDRRFLSLTSELSSLDIGAEITAD
jgi:transposase-like protein